MFYLTYRPKRIEDIDNTNVSESLKKILGSQDLPHALLFVGQKGTGKTSSARIFAKSVNCTDRESGREPCNKCVNCRSIDSASAIDVIEMDAASNRGIEEIKNLIRESSFLPMHNKYRVFIIDEAHMITTDAFNALLKTLEEPPKSAIFILATTNLDKVPKTIQSRCFIVNFGKAKRPDIIKMLKRVVAAEKITIGNDVLKLISEHSENSFRDAAKLLEELKMQGKLTYDEAKNFLGILGKQDLLEVIEKKDLKDALLWIEEFNQSGGSFKNLLEQLLEELRVLLLIKNKVIAEDEDNLRSFSTPEISRLMKLFTEAYNLLKISPIDSLPLEIAVVDFYNNR